MTSFKIQNDKRTVTALKEETLHSFTSYNFFFAVV
jgi:hypothetical protein